MQILATIAATFGWLQIAEAPATLGNVVTCFLVSVLLALLVRGAVTYR